MFGKPLEYWAVMAGMVLYVIMRNAETEPISKRAVKTAASAFLAYGLSPTLAPWTQDSEVLSAIAIMALGLIVLDTATALIGDRDFLKDIIKSRWGGDGGNG